MDIISLISAENYVVVNKTLATLYGNDAAILIGRFASLQKYNDGEFYRTFKKIEEDVNIKEAKARTIITMLIGENILTKESRGIPRKVYYTLNEEVLFNILLNPAKSMKFRTSKEEVQELRRTRYKNSDLRGSIYKDKNTVKRIHKEINKEKFYLDLFSNEWNNDSQFQNLLNEYINHRKEKRSSLTKTAWIRLASKLKKYPLPDVCEALEVTLENGWLGVFPESLKQSKSSNDKFKGGAPKHLEKDHSQYLIPSPYNKKPIKVM